MEMTPEMQELLKREMAEYLATYWNIHATPEQEARRAAEGKTFDGAYKFIESVVSAYRHGRRAVAIPDEAAYWLLMEYMDNMEEGSLFKSPDDAEKEAQKAKAELERLEKKAAEMSANSLFTYTVDDVRKLEAQQKAEREAKKAAKAARAADAARRIADRMEQMTLI